MRRSLQRVAGLAAVILLVVGVPPGVARSDTTWTVKSALKQVDEATKDVRGIAAEVHWNQLIGSTTIDGAGRLRVTMDGKLRADVEGNAPRTIIGIPPRFYVHDRVSERVDVYDMFTRPNLLVQYILLGFSPRGSDLKKLYEVKLIRESTLDDRRVLQFSLTSKSKLIAGSISVMQLWIDMETWLPAQQVILHTGGLQITVRYLQITRDDDLSDSLFQADWPEGTKIVTHD
jgi:outer membrane lipoprotein-sorting protein